ncbi:hypothetical protein HHL24_28965 [Paraburkholderia sp. RP-4-7]|uniref:Sulfotransferase family protein n=1 Tax=Paraburkholderia polaris TaxID=2728848 RepID=A0A848IKZ7_9BURK|nr:sulfotransferase [Paraburkholderia polaris]NMM01950.1 hypothetical protein [Paraburkholderia polaris]
MINNLFMSVGAMRSSTTWLYSKLQNHPDIYFPPVKEIHYFTHARNIYDFESKENRTKWLNVVFSEQGDQGPEYFSENADRLDWFARYVGANEVSDEWYQSLYKDSEGRKYCADFSNLNSILDDTGWQLVRKNCTKIKAIYVLRDPFERVWSHYKHEMNWNGLAHEVQGKNFDLFVATLNKEWFWEQARYDLAIKRLKQSLSDDEFKVFYFEDFHSNPDKTLSELCNFLEIDESGLLSSKTEDKVNSSTPMAIPHTFAIHLHDKLSSVYDELALMGFSHPQWKSYKNNIATSAELLRLELEKSGLLLVEKERVISSLTDELSLRGAEIASLQESDAAHNQQSLRLERLLTERDERMITMTDELLLRDARIASLQQSNVDYCQQSLRSEQLLAERDEQIIAINRARENELENLNAVVREHETQAAVFDEALIDLKKQLAERQMFSAFLETEVTTLTGAVNEREIQIAKLAEVIAEHERLVERSTTIFQKQTAEIENLSKLAAIHKREAEEALQQLREKEVLLREIHRSPSWRLTRPFRRIREI